MIMVIYGSNSLVRNSTWGDFFPKDERHPKVTVNQEDGPETIEQDKDGWYDVSVQTFDRPTVILVLALINECEPEQIELQEQDLSICI